MSSEISDSIGNFYFSRMVIFLDSKVMSTLMFFINVRISGFFWVRDESYTACNRKIYKILETFHPYTSIFVVIMKETSMGIIYVRIFALYCTNKSDSFWMFEVSIARTSSSYSFISKAHFCKIIRCHDFSEFVSSDLEASSNNFFKLFSTDVAR